MRTWTPKIPELSQERVGELQRFCWQYREKKARIAAQRDASGAAFDSMPHGSGGIGRPTEQKALYALESKDARDVALIEEAAMEAAAGSSALYACLIANVCDRVAVQYLSIPQGINQFTKTRRRFFCALDKKR